MTATTAASAAAGASPTSARPWLASYPPGVPATIDEAALITLAAMFRDSVRDLCRAPGGRELRQAHELRRAREGGATPSRPGCRRRACSKRRPGRDHAAERDGLSGDPARRAHRRLHGRQRQPALHRPRARPSAATMPALACSSCSRISATRSRRRYRSLSSTRSWSSRRATSWVSKGAIVNLVSRHVKKAVKPYNLPASIPFKTVLAEGRKSAPKPVERRAR